MRTTDVYVIEADHGVKVGVTRMGPEARLKELCRAGGFRDAYVVRTWLMTYTRARKVEAGAHWYLSETRTVGEWFQCHPFEACDAVERSIRHGLPLEATYTAEEVVNIRNWLAASKSRESSVRHGT